ncbi:MULTISPECIES: DUF4158 domain-containing protein [unclassified Streptomyces]|uniref:DUF4158 domain-containing protein n=1 Tax=unclassified Streptomyces TaxID=2593676 RepID=UPI00352CFB10
MREIAEYLGWKPPKTIELKELDEFLLARAMEHDAPSLLFRLGCEYLRSAKVIRPGASRSDWIYGGLRGQFSHERGRCHDSAGSVRSPVELRSGAETSG